MAFTKKTTNLVETPVKSEAKGSGTAFKPAAAPIASSSAAPTYDQISKRAYELYAGRGYQSGDPTADWLEAERLLKAGK